MKRQQITLALAACFFLFSFSTVFGQEKNNKVKLLPVNTQFEIDFSQVESQKVSNGYTMDISALNFNSPDVLERFCELFSFDFHKLNGDFETQTISIELDQKTIKERGYSMRSIETHFLEFSPRMQYTFNKLNI